jgi:tetratricopeptide (TPR) repeat protein
MRRLPALTAFLLIAFAILPPGQTISTALAQASATASSAPSATSATSSAPAARPLTPIVPGPVAVAPATIKFADAAPLVKSGQEHLDKNDPKETQAALDDFSAAVVANPDDAKARCGWGQALFRQGNGDAALVEFTTAIKLDSSSPAGYVLRGNLFMIAKAFDKAKADFDAAIKLDHKDAKLYLYRAQADYFLQKPDDAVADLTRAIALDDKYALAYNFRGIIYLQDGRLDDALQDFGKAIEKDPKLLDAYANVGLCRLRESGVLLSGFFAYAGGKSEDDVQKDLRHAGLLEEVKIGMGVGAAAAPEGSRFATFPEAMWKLHVWELDQAMVTLAKAILLDDKHVGANLYMAQALIAHGRPADAATYYDKVVKAIGPAPEAAIPLAWIWATCPTDSVRNGKAAVELIEPLAKEHANNSAFLDVLAAAYAEAGRFNSAINAERSARDIAADKGMTDLAAMYEARLNQYLQSTPYREPPRSMTMPATAPRPVSAPFTTPVK